MSLPHKVLFLIDNIGLGGAQAVLQGVVNASKEDENVFLYSLRKCLPHIEMEHQHLKVFESDEKFTFKPVREIVEIIRENDIGVLHCHLFRSQVTGWLIKKFYCPELRLIFHEHGQIFGSDCSKLFHRVLVSFFRWTISSVDVYFAVSKATKEELIKRSRVPSDKIEVLHNFVDLERHAHVVEADDKEDQKPLAIEGHEGLEDELKGKFVVGFVGRLSNIKGCDVLLRAFAAWNEKGSARLVLVGDGPERENLVQLVQELGLDESVRFLGFVQKIEAVYRHFDVMVLPSFEESFGNVILEAQSHGVPVISTNIAGPAEIISDQKNGLLVPPKSVDALKEALKGMRDNVSLREALVRAGHENVEKFSLKNYLTKLYDLIRRYGGVDLS